MCLSSPKSKPTQSVEAITPPAPIETATRVEDPERVDATKKRKGRQALRIQRDATPSATNVSSVGAGVSV